jgi:hypothetical protein
VSVVHSVQLSALLALLLWTTPLLSAEVGGPCGRERADWRQAHQRLKTVVEDYRQIKRGSIAPMIEKEIIEKERSESTAAMVRTVLEDRKLRMAEARKKLDALLVEEKHHFDQLRRCVSRSRRSSNRVPGSRSDEQARESVMAGLPDLLMDEAYQQYKNERPRSVSRYSYYGSEPSPWERYQGQPAPGWRTGYSGGFGRAPQRYPTQRYPYQGYFRRR